MKYFFVITMFILIQTKSVMAAITGPTTEVSCRLEVGEVCCYTNQFGGCMRCAASYDACPKCTCPASGCSSTSWTSSGTTGTYHRCAQVAATQPLEICGCAYSCANGYYLNGSTCELCPPFGNISAKSAEYNTAGVSSCYISSTDSVAHPSSDGTGTWHWNNDCYYK